MEKMIELYAFYATEKAETKVCQGIFLNDDGKISDDKWSEVKKELEDAVKRTDDK